MKEILELNEYILKETGEHPPRNSLILGRDGAPKELEKVPEHLVKKINLVRAALNEAIPDDFGYLLCLGDPQPSLMLKYDNGAMTSGGRGHNWNDERSIYEQLRELDWDEERASVIQGTQRFDAITEMAKELPIMLPTTKALQKQCRDTVKAYIKEKRGEASIVHALLWDGESFLDKDSDSLKEFRQELPDIMTHMVHVVTVVANGKPLPAERIDALKKAALHELEDMPISHAKASGKDAYMMTQARGRAKEE